MVMEEELKRVYGMFTDCWKLYKKFAGIQQAEDIRWEQLVSESDTIAKTYDNNKFVRSLMLATIQELERQSKEVGKE
ncbi:MAG: hypothetical protein K2N44_18280 [Lachnospiraceae bacterium]|nr:hypothetical protein [Lachnospiraceae bacterium]